MVKRILALDRNPFIRYLLARAFQSAATVVVTVAQIEKAVAELKAHPYDLFFVDLQALNHSALEIMGLLRELSPSTRIMLMAESSSGYDLGAGLHEVINCFIPKPFFPSEIRQLVGKSLGLGEHFWKQSQPSSERTYAERRRQERTPVTETIEYTLDAARKGAIQPKLRGDIVNISDSGIGMLTEHPIASGTLLNFCDRLDHNEGIVAWCRKVDNCTYSTGIVFV
ncbi:MAG: response regulator [Acidobacteriota bacterium]